MAWRIDRNVARGELDNRQRGIVRGTIWLAGRTEPLTLTLRGNGHRDWAGGVLRFVNPAPHAAALDGLQPAQEGIVGDITASRKVRVLDVPIEEASRLAKAGLPVPEHRGNALYLEWFSDANGRVVIETADYQISVTDIVWRMSASEHAAQLAANQQAMTEWMERLASAMDQKREENDSDDEPPLDEFGWETFLKQSDARTAKYGELLEKYEGHPDQDRLVAREMGWTWIEEALEAEAKGALPESPAPDDDDLPPREPDPLTEGRDWVRGADGSIHHPLQLRMFEVAQAMWHECDEQGLLGETGDADLHEMISQAQCTCAKLAGALNSLAYETGPDEAGMVVALLKRSLVFLNESLASVERVAGKNLVPATRLAGFRNDLLAIREDILALMERYRQQMG